MVSTGDDVTHIACLDSIVAVLVHQCVSLLDMALVVLGRRTGLVVHQDFHALGVGIVVEHLEVEVWIGCLEVEHIAFPHVCPVFPADIPTLYQYLVESVLGSEVNVSLDLLVVGSMTAIRLHLVPVDVVEFDGREVVGIVPSGLADYHLPPYATVLGRMNP